MKMQSVDIYHKTYIYSFIDAHWYHSCDNFSLYVNFKS